MKFTPEQIGKLEELSKLRLSAEEKKQYTSDLEGILAHADEIAGVDTTDVLPTAQVTGLTNINRADKPENQELEGGEILLQHSAQEVEMKQIKVPNVL